MNDWCFTCSKQHHPADCPKARDKDVSNFEYEMLWRAYLQLKKEIKEVVK